MLKKLMSVVLTTPESDKERSRNLTWCLRSLPNLEYRGFVSMTRREFDNHALWQGNLVTFMHHMFEKHQGETVALNLEVGLSPVNNPYLEQMHNSQFFTDPHPSDRMRGAKTAALLYRRNRTAASGADLDLFLGRMREFPNSVFRPVADTQGHQIYPVTVSYHSLQSLVWECCGECQLNEIYTFFCSTKLLTCAQPKAKRGEHGKGGGEARGIAHRHHTGKGTPSPQWLDALA
jgi:hypothetical protein